MEGLTHIQLLEQEAKLKLNNTGFFGRPLTKQELSERTVEEWADESGAWDEGHE